MPYAVPPTRTAAVVHQLRDEVVTGLLPPGTLIKDSEVAARLGVSITPVREAIAQLLEAGDRAGAVQRYRDIYAEARRRIERLFLDRA